MPVKMYIFMLPGAQMYTNVIPAEEEFDVEGVIAAARDGIVNEASSSAPVNMFINVGVDPWDEFFMRNPYQFSYLFPEEVCQQRVDGVHILVVEEMGKQAAGVVEETSRTPNW